MVRFTTIVLAHITNVDAVYWARQRKFVHAYLMGAHDAGYSGIMDFEAKRWLYRLLNEPEKHVSVCLVIRLKLTRCQQSYRPYGLKAHGLFTVTLTVYPGRILGRHDSQGDEYSDLG